MTVSTEACKYYVKLTKPATIQQREKLRLLMEYLEQNLESQASTLFPLSNYNQCINSEAKAASVGGQRLEQV